MALVPSHWGQGLASDAVKAVAEHARSQGSTYALLAPVAAPNARAHALMQRCGFEELGRIAGPIHHRVVYELAL